MASPLHRIITSCLATSFIWRSSATAYPKVPIFNTCLAIFIWRSSRLVAYSISICGPWVLCSKQWFHLQRQALSHKRIRDWRLESQICYQQSSNRLREEAICLICQRQSGESGGMCSAKGSVPSTFWYLSQESSNNLSYTFKAFANMPWKVTHSHWIKWLFDLLWI